MCTVTVVRGDDLLRVAVNRDELRRRPAAHPPFISRAGAQLVLTPQDPEGGGTWVAANGSGLVFALLNAHPPQRAARGGGPSRGLVIPSLADAESLEEVAWRADALDDAGYAPFRLLAIDDRDVLELRLDDRRGVEMHRITRPLLFTSSGLGDALVDGPRRLLFGQMLGATPDPAAVQDAFHAHRWRDRPAVSVHMSRPDACTVSTTVVEVTRREVRMVYQPAHCDVGTPIGLVIDRRQVDHAAARARRQHAAV